MSDQGFWKQDWMKVQMQYWEQWTEMSRQALEANQSSAAPWESAMALWWKAVSPAAPDVAREFMSKMMEQGKVLFNMAESFAGKLPGEADGDGWNEALNKIFADLRKGFADAAGAGGDDALRKLMAFWEMPLENWQRMVSALSLSPDDILRNMPHGDAHAQLERLLSVAGLGYLREEQGRQQQLMQKLVEYQRALQEYSQFFSDLGVRSVDRMRLRLDEVSKAGKVIDSAKALYDVWVGACEEVYSEQVMTVEYARLHGRLVNALMAVKQQMLVMMDEGLGAMSMPTHRELRTLQQRVQENRREIKALKAEVAELKRQVEAQAARPAPAVKKRAAPKRKAAPKKKTAAKR